MSLQERTLVVKNFDPDKTSQKLLKELCLQAGPVRNVVVRQDHAFVEFEDTESVGFSKALLDGVILHGRKLHLEPKIKTHENYVYTKILHDYIKYEKQRRAQEESQRKSFQSYSNNQRDMTKPWSANGQSMNMYNPQQIMISQQYNMPLAQMPVSTVHAATWMLQQPQQQQPMIPQPQLQQQHLQATFIQSNGYIPAQSYASPVAQIPVNPMIHMMPNQVQNGPPNSLQSSETWLQRRR